MLLDALILSFSLDELPIIFAVVLRVRVLRLNFPKVLGVDKTVDSPLIV